jgi:acyl transferase domain-containing protein/acyl carrier protein
VKTGQVEQWLVQRVAMAVGVPPAEIDVDATFSDHGLDSAAAAELAAGLGELLGSPVPATALFDHPTISDLAVALSSPRPNPQLPARPRSGHMTAPRGAVAVVGIACRLPGAGSADEFWQLLTDGHDSIGAVPPARWPGHLKAQPIALGGFLDDIEGFDAAYFRIPREEALRMDPQQRLLLEVAQECLEDAGISDTALRGSRTGVFVGISASEYVRRQLSTDKVTAVTPTGNALSIAANRLSYLFDLRGPSIAVDTACSSSLVAMHLALRAMRNGDCDQAIVAGVNALLDPETSIALAKAGFLASDGRCKTFDASADGYGRAEGCGAVFLKPLDDALAEKDRVHAVVLGSAVNQDGRSNGLTAPNPAAQEAVVAAAYADAAVDPQTVSYVECHGTGTLLGDPIEVRSLSRVLVGPNRVRPLLVGSVKTNVGHLESAAGIAGFIKTALMLRKGQLAPSPIRTAPNPNIPFEELQVEVVTDRRAWPEVSPVAGVSSFGFGGTNAHVVLAGPPPRAAALAETGGPVLLPVSAASPQAFSELAAAFAARLRALDPSDLEGFAFSAGVRRSHYAIRETVIGATPSELAARLEEAADRPNPPVSSSARPRIAFVFSGQGSQEVAATRSLLRSNPLFRSVIARCDEALDGALGYAIRDLIEDERLAPLLDATELAQPLIVAVQIATVEVLRSLGLSPASVIGHSVGEISAAYAAGALAFDEAIKLAHRRGAAMAPTAGKGRMLAVGVDESQARALIRPEHRVDIAAVNGPAATVLSGDAEALAQIAQGLSAAGRFARLLPLDYAFHSHQMEHAAQAMADEPPRKPAGDVCFYSTVLGGAGHDDLATPGYWARNVRGTVRFLDGVRAILNDGVDVLVEVAPAAALQTPLRQLTRGSDRAPVVTATATAADEPPLLYTLAAAYRAGAALDWSRLYQAKPPFVPFPTYRWQHTRLSLDRPAGYSRAYGEHPLLGARVELAWSGAPIIWESDISAAALAMLRDHRVAGATVLPASAYIDLLVAAARDAGISGAICVERLRLHALLALPQESVRIQTVLTSQPDGGYQAEVYSRSMQAAAPWVSRASAHIAPASCGPPAADLAAARRRCVEHLASQPFYERLARIGLEYGPSFRTLGDIWRADGEAVADLAAADPGYAIGPRSLDGAFQLVAAAVPGLPQAADLHVPVGFDRMTVAGTVPREALLGYVQVRSGSAAHVADAILADIGGCPIVTIEGLRFQPVLSRRSDRAAEGVWLYETRWLEQADARSGASLAGKLAVIFGTGTDASVADALREAGAVVVVLDSPGQGPEQGADCVVEGYRARLLSLRASGSSPDVIVYSTVRSPKPAPARAFDLGWDLVALIQAVSFSEGASLPALWVVTRGAQSTHANGIPPVTDGIDPCAAALWGIAAVVPFENPALRCRCIDVDDDSSSLRRLAAEVADPTDDAQIAFRAGHRLVRRLVPAATPQISTHLELAGDGVYVVTGGTGSIGVHVARWLASRGARRVALLSRTAAPATALAELESASGGAAIISVLCDVSIRSDLDQALAEVRAHGPIRGIVHAAGVLDDGALLAMTAEQFAAPLRPKVAGAWWLMDLTAGDPLEWVAFFSSAAGLLGSPGQSNYAAANAFLDAFAASLHTRGAVVLSIDWGPWAVGMAADWSSGTSGAVKLLDPAAAVGMLEQLVSVRRPPVMVLPFDLRDLLQFFPAGVGFRLFDELQTADLARLRSVGTQAGPMPRPALAEEYVAPRNEVERSIAEIWQIALGIDRVGVFDSFFELGGDSVFGNQIIAEISNAMSVHVDAALAFEQFTVARLSELAEKELVTRLESMSDEEAAALLADTE